MTERIPAVRPSCWRVVAGLCALLMMSCAAPVQRPGILDEEGNSVWRRLESAHFVVESNVAEEAHMRRIAEELETLWAAFAAVPLLGRRPPATKPLVVLLRRRSELPKRVS